jgi:hypothetical protein
MLFREMMFQGVVNVELFLCEGGGREIVETQLISFLATALDGGEW